MAKAYYVRGFRNKPFIVSLTNREFGIHPENVYFILGFDTNANPVEILYNEDGY